MFHLSGSCCRLRQWPSALQKSSPHNLWDSGKAKYLKKSQGAVQKTCRIRKHVYTCMYPCIHTPVYTYININLYTYTYVRLCSHLRTGGCPYIYIHIHLYIYTICFHVPATVDLQHAYLSRYCEPKTAAFKNMIKKHRTAWDLCSGARRALPDCNWVALKELGRN